MGEPVFETRAELEAWVAAERASLEQRWTGNHERRQFDARIRRVVAAHSHLKDAAP